MTNLEKTNLLIDEHNYYSYQEECAICFDEITDVKNRKILNCGHIFHKDCINSWTKLNPICPYCREYMTNYFDCWIKDKNDIFYKKCKIYLDEKHFSKMVIDIFSPIKEKINKQYIIPTTFIKCVKQNKRFCDLYFKETTKTEVDKYSIKFKDINNASQFSEKLKKIFKKYLDFYKSIKS